MFTWTPEMIRFMQNANARSEYHRQLAAILAPKLAGCRTLCDACLLYTSPSPRDA